MLKGRDRQESERFVAKTSSGLHSTISLAEDRYAHLTVGYQVLVRNLLVDLSRLTPRQETFVRHRASVDFVVYKRVTNHALLGMRLITRRTPCSANKPAKLGEHPDWEDGALVTNTPDGQVQYLDARHRTQAPVEDRIKQSRPAAPATCPRSTTAATPPGYSWPPWPPR